MALEILHISRERRRRVGFNCMIRRARTGGLACATMINTILYSLTCTVLCLLDMLLNSSSPVVLYLIIRSSRQMLRNFRPPILLIYCWIKFYIHLRVHTKYVLIKDDDNISIYILSNSIIYTKGLKSLTNIKLKYDHKSK